MAAKKKAKKGSGDLIISKSRTKGATKRCNVSSDFYSALDKTVRGLVDRDRSRLCIAQFHSVRDRDLVCERDEGVERGAAFGFVELREGSKQQVLVIRRCGKARHPDGQMPFSHV